MNTALVNSETVALLSQITGQKLNQRQITPPVIFLAALVTVLLGVMFADGTVADEKKQKLQKILDHVTPSGSQLRKFTQILIKGVQQHQVYQQFNELIKLTAPLTEPERLLLVSFAYQISAIDRDISSQEKSYLQDLANQLEVNPEYLAVLVAGFSKQGTINSEALGQVHALLNPANFQSVNPLLVSPASYIIAELPAIPLSADNQTVNSYSLELQQSATKLKQFIQDCFNELKQAETVLNTKPQIAKLAKQKLLEKLGECSGLYVKISHLEEKFKKQTIEQAKTSWQKWIEKLKENLQKEWFADVRLEEEKVEDKNQLAQDYAQEFRQELIAKLDDWLNNLITVNIQGIDQDLEMIQENIIELNQDIAIDLEFELIQEIEEVKKSLYSNTEYFEEYFGGDESESNLLEWAFDTTGLILGAVTSGIAGVFKFGGRGSDVPQPSIKQKVFEQSWNQLEQSQDEIFNKVQEIIVVVIADKIQSSTNIAEQAVSLYEVFIEQQQRYQEETTEQRSAEKAWILQQRQALGKVYKNVNAVRAQIL
ncbi:MAG: hypothetical protein F6K41_36085 [Symploca sp. SIO3E6]|nr:hypothetical protein [Caldora sp. SIO3E6]